ncbi:MAG: hypothetical protein Q9167_000430 [Letrouitia subvulpina]
MAAFTREDANRFRETFQAACVKCSERCLYQSAKWIAELATSLPLPNDGPSTPDTETDSPMRDVEQQSIPIIPSVAFSSSSKDPEEARLESQELSRYLLAKSFFDCREYDRCAAVFIPITPVKIPISTPPSPGAESKPSPSSAKRKGREKRMDDKEALPGSPPPNNSLPKLSQKSLFLALYAKYLAGEKRKDEDSEMILGPADTGSVMNKELVIIGRSLEGWFAERASEGREDGNQGWLEYLYGLVLAKGKSEEDAKQWLLRSVHLFPYNWSAWLELGDLLSTFDDLQRLVADLPRNIMALIFHLHASQELYQSTDDVLQELSSLEEIFPSSDFLKTQRALLYYHAKDFEAASSTFSSRLTTSPHNLTHLDHYSNILYVLSLRPALSFLAHLATSTDRFRPETCVIVGNYYSLVSEHEKAVMYFRRALTLDRSFLSAWTLMGHEYVEMKNTHAAIESYRRAVDVNRKDYRAWYGLGQTYEVLEMHLYALFYYQRAASLRPYDAKMWQAVGSCYDRVGRPQAAIRAWKRALVAGTYYEPQASFGGSSSGESQGILDPETLYQIALLYEKMGEMEEAASYMESTIAQEEGPVIDSPNQGEGEGQGGTPSRASGGGEGSTGTGVTNTTSRARMWLAKWEFSQGNLARAMDLASELCHDGWEVEEAKALVRDLRGRMERGRE